MNCGTDNENCAQESPELGHSEVGDQYNHLVGNSLQKNAGGNIGRPLGKRLSSDVGTTGVINPDADDDVRDKPVLVVTPEWQKQSWKNEVEQAAEDNHPESVVSFNSENESDGGSWTFEDGPDANLKTHQLQIQNMTSINEALKARVRKVERELSDNEMTFKKQLREANFKHAESMQAQQKLLFAEQAAAMMVKQGFYRDHDQLAGQHHEACVQIEYQTGKINALEAELSDLLNQVKASDGSIYTRKQIQNIIEVIKREAEAPKEFYKNQVKTLEHQLAGKVALLDKGAKESRDLEQKLSNEQKNCKDILAMLELERKSHADSEETSLRNFNTRVQEALSTVEHRDRQIQQMDNIIRNLQAHLIAAQQSYAAAMGTAENLHRAHEKLSEENRDLVQQHRHDMEVIDVSHRSACDVYSSNEVVLREEIAMLTKKLSLTENFLNGRWKATVACMKQEIIDLRADLRTANDTLTSSKKDIDSQLPDRASKKEAGSQSSEGLDALGEAVVSADEGRLDKGKGVADDIAEKRYLEAAENLEEIAGSALSKMQVTFRKMAEAKIRRDMKTESTPKAMHSDQPSQPSEQKPAPMPGLLGGPTQPPKSKSTPMAVHSDKPTQPLKSKPASAPAHSDQPTQPSNAKATPTATHSNKPTQPSKPRSASVPRASAGQPPKPSSVFKVPTPTKSQPGHQFKETPPAAAQPASSRSFSVYHESDFRIKPHSAPVKITDEVPVKSADIERSRPDPDPDW
ncbi:hypothetical protein VE03_01922 [Pseudogymnoascus sp. 23342-1-I1]|nr:hypothetical protein VE03_01922 [Pseudogymnoascus sp. 23342-1-I1]